MEIDPVLAAVVGAVNLLAGIIFKLMLQRAERAEKDAEFWRDKYLVQTGLALIATDEAEKRQNP